MELSADPYSVDIEQLTDHVKVLGTWSGGRKIDLDAFMSDIDKIDPAQHKALTQHVAMTSGPRLRQLVPPQPLVRAAPCPAGIGTNTSGGPRALRQFLGVEDQSRTGVPGHGSSPS